MKPRTIAVGDIHGCADALTSLLDEISPTAHDTIVLLGDVIDRGPNSRDVIDTLMSLSSTCQLVFVQGNHEEMLLDSIENPEKLPRWLRNGGTNTLAAYGCDSPSKLPQSHIDFIRSSIPYCETEDHIFVHAGYVENLDLQDQPALALRWRVTNENTLPHCSGKTVFTGHTPQKSGKILDMGHVICIDTDCYRGGWLSGYDVNSRFVWQANDNREIRFG